MRSTYGNRRRIPHHAYKAASHISFNCHVDIGIVDSDFRMRACAANKSGNRILTNKIRINNTQAIYDNTVLGVPHKRYNTLLRIVKIQSTNSMALSVDSPWKMMVRITYGEPLQQSFRIRSQWILGIQDLLVHHNIRNQFSAYIAFFFKTVLPGYGVCQSVKFVGISNLVASIHLLRFFDFKPFRIKSYGVAVCNRRQFYSGPCNIKSVKGIFLQRPSLENIAFALYGILPKKNALCSSTIFVLILQSCSAILVGMYYEWQAVGCIYHSNQSEQQNPNFVHHILLLWLPLKIHSFLLLSGKSYNINTICWIRADFDRKRRFCVLRAP